MSETLNENKNFKPSSAPGSVTERIVIMIKIINNSGIRNLETFSIPAETPLITINAVSAINPKCHNIGSTGDEMNSTKKSAVLVPKFAPVI